MQLYCNSLTRYSRLKTLEVKIGDLFLGNGHPIRVQTMTTTNTMDTMATVAQSIRCIEAGAELIRITAPSKNEAENLLNIKNELRRKGYTTPLVADIHFTPNAAEIAARIVEKVRINPGNYIDKKKFAFIDYTDAEYNGEIDRIRERFSPLVKICKEYGTAMEFLRVARDESYHNIVLSMKSSNPLVMVQAYRLLVRKMDEEFGVCYPLHLGVTEAGDGEDGRIKSAIGIGALLEDGIGDTIRVSLTEDPEFEIPVCKDLVKRYEGRAAERAERGADTAEIAPIQKIPYSPFEYRRRVSRPIVNLGGHHVPIVVADFSGSDGISREDLRAIGYSYDPVSDKWNIKDAAADFIYTGGTTIDFDLPGTLRPVIDYMTWEGLRDYSKYIPLFHGREFDLASRRSDTLNFVSLDVCSEDALSSAESWKDDPTVVLCCTVPEKGSGPASHPLAMQAVRRFMMELMIRGIESPVIFNVTGSPGTIDEKLIQFSAEAGSLFLDGMGDGIWLKKLPGEIHGEIVNARASGRTYLEAANNHQFLNNTSFSILQATRTRISRTEYISCPSCGRTLFDLQETTAKIRSFTHHLKGVKIAIMGCIVNGPGEMADADFGYVGSGPGKITLYKGKEIVKRGVDSSIAMEELINLLKESEAWIDEPH